MFSTCVLMAVPVAIFGCSSFAVSSLGADLPDPIPGTASSTCNRSLKPIGIEPVGGGCRSGLRRLL